MGNHTTHMEINSSVTPYMNTSSLSAAPHTRLLCFGCPCEYDRVAPLHPDVKRKGPDQFNRCSIDYPLDGRDMPDLILALLQLIRALLHIVSMYGCTSQV